MNLKISATRQESSGVFHRPHRRIAVIYSNEYVLHCRHAWLQAQLLCQSGTSTTAFCIVQGAFLISTQEVAVIVPNPRLEHQSEGALVSSLHKKCSSLEKGEVWLTRNTNRKSFSSVGWKEFPIKLWKCILVFMRVT